MNKQEWVSPKIELLSISQTLNCDYSKVGPIDDGEGCTPVGSIPTS
jgi:hypothetical protein